MINTKTLEPKLIDFGSAVKLKSPNQKFVAFAGTLVYAPPEWEAGLCYQPGPSTVWTLGIVLYVMIYGYTPEQKNFQHDRFYASKDLINLMDQMLESNPTKRVALCEISKQLRR